jgi:hypothetical protein
MSETACVKVTKPQKQSYHKDTKLTKSSLLVPPGWDSQSLSKE